MTVTVFSMEERLIKIKPEKDRQGDCHVSGDPRENSFTQR